MTHDILTNNLINCFNNSPYPTFKVTNYFAIYSELLGHLVGTDCTFIETGILNGGSLFMWRDWLGPRARIIGVDLNPNAKKWEDYGFEIYIGDQGSINFWDSFYQDIGNFDAFIDDGGHQSFQQIVTLNSAVDHINQNGVILIEDTCTSNMREFSDHGPFSFLEYSKAVTDVISSRNRTVWPDDFQKIRNNGVIEKFKNISSVNFYTGIVAFIANLEHKIIPNPIWNKIPEICEHDYRHLSLSKSCRVSWPDPYNVIEVEIFGSD